MPALVACFLSVSLLFVGAGPALPDGVSVAEVASVNSSSGDTVLASFVRQLPGHPRLFANENRFLSLRTQTDSVSRQLKALVLSQAEAALTADSIRYPSQGFKFGAMRTVQGRLLALALSYRLTGDTRFLTRARVELRQLAALPDWAPNHFLDVGEGALAAGVGLDWLYADLPAAERDQLTKAIIRNALLPSLNVPEGSNAWVDGDFNWNQVCHGGLVVGALAVAEQEPALARKIINRAIKNLPKAGAVYAPDGAYPEGPSYWAYGTTFHVLLIEALRSALGSSCGLEGFPGFLKTADYNLQMVGPSGLDFNYSDYHVEHLNEPIMLWFARETHRPGLARQEVADLQTLYNAQRTQTDNPLRASRHLPLELLWWEPQAVSNSSTPLPRHWTSRGVLPLAAMRSDWGDSTATFVAIKGGTPHYSHAHMDVGSFVLEADGVRWAIDLGTESYDKMRAAKLDMWNYDQTSTRWTTFRVGPDGHNILRFDDALQRVAGRADMREMATDAGRIGNVVELTPVYRGQVDQAQRTVVLNPDRSVSLTDQWTTANRPITAAWQWLTRATVSQTAQGLLLQQAGQTLTLRIQSSAPYTIAVEDVSQPRQPQDSPNPGVSRIVLRQATAANTTATLRVDAIPGRVFKP